MRLFIRLAILALLTLAIPGARVANARDAAPTSRPPKASAGYVVSPTLEGAPPYHADFDITKGMTRSSIPKLDTKGSFRFICAGNAPLRSDDPVLYPGQPGLSHLHQPWGNADFSAFTTPDSLLKSAQTDCNDTKLSVNRSLYWMPALIHDSGVAIQPDLVAVYYKRWAKASPQCTPGDPKFVGTCVGLPNQIRFIFGWDMFRPGDAVKGTAWTCSGNNAKNLADLFAKGCKVGDTLEANTKAPQCWDGKHLDTPDHRSHTAYASYDRKGRLVCPASHPFTFPQEENKALFTVTADMIAADGTPRIRLSSDAMRPGAKPGETLHADYMEAWVWEAKRMWEEHCIDKGLNCSAGVLGNGFKLIGADKPRYGWKNPKARVPVPAHQH